MSPGLRRHSFSFLPGRSVEFMILIPFGDFRLCESGGGLERSPISAVLSSCCEFELLYMHQKQHRKMKEKRAWVCKAASTAGSQNFWKRSSPGCYELTPAERMALGMDENLLEEHDEDVWPEKFDFGEAGAPYVAARNKRTEVAAMKKLKQRPKFEKNRITESAKLEKNPVEVAIYKKGKHQIFKFTRGPRVIFPSVTHISFSSSPTTPTGCG